MNVRHLALSMLFASLAVAPLAAGDWTRFRGPNGTGVVDDPAIPAVPTEKDVAWKIELPGHGHSSPVIWGDKVFVTAATDEPPQHVVLCLDAKTGDKLWERRFDYKVHKKHTLNSFASPSPAVDAERVYVSWSVPESLTLLALTHDGKDVWTRDLGPFVSQHSAGNSPIVVDDMVILVNEQDDDDTATKDGYPAGGVSFLHCVKAADGATVWQVPRRNAVVTYSTPMVRTTADGGKELLVNSQAHGLSGLDLKTGKINWEMPELLKKRSVSSPIMAAGLVFGTCGSGGGGEYLVAVKPGPNPELKYEIKEGAPYVPSLVAKGDLVFAVNSKGIGTCFDAPTGNVNWRERIGGTNYFGSPIILNDRLYVISQNGTLIVLAAAKKFEKLGEFDLGEGGHSTPAVADGHLYLRTESHLTCVGKK